MGKYFGTKKFVPDGQILKYFSGNHGIPPLLHFTRKTSRIYSKLIASLKKLHFYVSTSTCLPNVHLKSFLEISTNFWYSFVETSTHRRHDFLRYAPIFSISIQDRLLFLIAILEFNGKEKGWHSDANL